MPQANPHRGDVAVTFGGKEFVLRPTWQAIVEIETSTGRGIVEIAQVVATNRHGLTMSAHIITAGLKAAGEPASYEKVCAMIHEKGVVNLSVEIDQFLTNALTGGMEPGEAKAADQK